VPVYSSAVVRAPKNHRSDYEQVRERFRLRSGKLVRSRGAYANRRSSGTSPETLGNCSARHNRCDRHRAARSCADTANVDRRTGVNADLRQRFDRLRRWSPDQTCHLAR
jgi:hypothetical protein